MERTPAVHRPTEDVGRTRAAKTQPQSKFSSPGCVAHRLAVDAAAASVAALGVAPLITIIDRGIIENASGKRSLMKSLKSGLKDIVMRPHKFFLGKPFGLIFMVYSGTYMSANLIDTVSSCLRSPPSSPSPSSTSDTDPEADIKTVTAGTAKFIATSAVNMSLCLYKDRIFTRLFSTLSTPRPVPLPTYFLFSARDCLTIFFSFNVPPMIAPLLPTNPHTGTVAAIPELGFEGWKPQTVTQLVAPAVCQIFSTPLHLLGLNLYNRPKVDAAARLKQVRKDWVKSALARMGRIVPAFGVGGVVNTGVRRWGLEGVERRWG